MSTPSTLAFTKAGTRVHIIGIGGAGMSAIARVLLDTGVIVTGSDQQISPVAQQLIQAGAQIAQGHRAENLPAALDLVLISSAVQPSNPELQAATARGIPVYKRRDALPYILPDKTMIAVAGTHGKTTTTALIAHILREAGEDPSYIVGGVMLNSGDNAHAGAGRAFVIEADEYDYMFLGLTPQISVLTNVEHDHPDMFPTRESVFEAFRQFIQRLPTDGLLICCQDDEGSKLLGEERRAAGLPVLFYSTIQPSAQWLASIDSSADTERTYFGARLHHAGERVYEQIISALAGEHNVRNALAALAAAHAYGLPTERIAPAFESFKGTGRRFELLGTSPQGLTIYSDYGHHPTAIKAVLEAARSRFPQQTIWALWQPHTFSRTRLLLEEFAASFGEANHVLVTDIYAARETATEDDPTGETAADAVWDAGHRDARYSGTLAQTSALLRAEANAGDVLIIFSAGDAPAVATTLLIDGALQ